MFKKAGIFWAMLIAVSYLSAEDVKLNGCNGVTLSTDMPLNKNYGFYFNVGLIYEQMRVSNTMSAYKKVLGPTSGESASDPTNTYTMYNFPFQMDPGFKFLLGYEHGHDHWQVNALFEWLESTAALVQEVQGTSAIKVPYDDDTEDYLKVKPTLDIDYYLLDVYLSRGSFISKKYSLEPVAGFKATWLYNKTDTDFLGGNSLTSRQVKLYVSKVRFWGVGPMIGLNSNYYLSAGWSIFALSDFSILLGESTLEYYNGVTTVETLPGDNRVMTTLQVLCPTMRGVLGLQYGKFVMCNSQHLAIRAGFDARVYFNQYPVANMSQNSNPLIIENGSFGMTGLLLDLGWSF